uniref:Plasmid stabilization system protein ParE n=1 Tax=Candidatus Kentrum sp. FW TaxID=2126338 RepID=A0A450T5Z8_9GAMM|nr:MAG: Plasmid stabilization system protein ParE [Candidatus Kentron sp. FW]VFJ70169.1 MAG: Plasmid stabilization system protein ParE [Candidatus Kentron sp. FW]
MTQLNWTKEADQWLRDIHAYIMKDNPVAAGQVISGIYDKAQLLMSFPEIGYRYRETPEGEVRVLLYGHYRIAYLYRKADARIDILGVFHGAMDMNRYFP